MSEDIENLIPNTNIILKNDHSIRIVEKRKREDSFYETNIQSIKIFKDIVNNNPTTYQKPQEIHQAICLTIEDVKGSTNVNDHWNFADILYRNVLIYGYAVVLNEFSRDTKHFYTIRIDDETEFIDGYLNKANIKAAQATTSGHEIRKQKETLDRRTETGIKLSGTYYPSSSHECIKAINNLKKLQLMIEENLKSTEKKFSLGPIKEKVLVYGTPILRNDTIKLRIIDLTLDDSLELMWKRNINRLYSECYFE